MLSFSFRSPLNTLNNKLNWANGKQNLLSFGRLFEYRTNDTVYSIITKHVGREFDVICGLESLDNCINRYYLKYMWRNICWDVTLLADTKANGNLESAHIETTSKILNLSTDERTVRGSHI